VIILYLPVSSLALLFTFILNLQKKKNICNFCYNYDHANIFSGFPLRIKSLKDEAVPSIFNWAAKESESSKDRNRRTTERAQKKLLKQDSQQSQYNSSTNEDMDCSYVIDDCEIEVACVEVTDSSQVCTLKSEMVLNEKPHTVDSSSQTGSGVIPVIRMSSSDYKDDPHVLQFYTGLDTYRIFLDVFTSLGPAVNHLTYLNDVHPSIEPVDQFFLTLVKLRLYKTNFELGIMFKVSEKEIYSTIITWIRFMSLQWREIDLWPERDIVHYHAPSDFKAKFPKTRVVFDGTECPIKKPKAPAAQQTTFSTYKNRNTNKVLIGVTPGGLVSYVSPAYGGSTSDRQIVERSDLTSKLDPTDSIMADKGFDVQDIFAPMDVTVNIPTFFKKKNRMSGKTVLRDRAVSSKRVHVERVIGLGKTYKILCNPLNHTEAILSSDIIFVCYMLVNFSNCIVPKNAYIKYVCTHALFDIYVEHYYI